MMISVEIIIMVYSIYVVCGFLVILWKFLFRFIRVIVVVIDMLVNISYIVVYVLIRM